MGAWQRLGLTRAQWFSLPLALRRRWWRETDYSATDPSPDLVSAVLRELGMAASAVLLGAALAAPALADTVTVGYWDKSLGGAVTPLISEAGPITATSPIVQIVQHPLLLGSGFGFDQVAAMVIPPTGNVLSGGLGGAFPSFEFTFNDGFAPPQGGNIRLYATWQGTLPFGGSITLPSRFSTDEMPPGVNGFTVAEQIFMCGNVATLFCDNFVTGGGTLIGQDDFHDTLRIDTVTLTGFLPGQPFAITEVFDFTQDRGSFPFAPQGDVGATIMTTLNPVTVPAPIVGAGLPGFASALGLLGYLQWRRRRTGEHAQPRSAA